MTRHHLFEPGSVYIGDRSPDGKLESSRHFAPSKGSAFAMGDNYIGFVEPCTEKLDHRGDSEIRQGYGRWLSQPDVENQREDADNAASITHSLQNETSSEESSDEEEPSEFVLEGIWSANVLEGIGIYREPGKTVVGAYVNGEICLDKFMIEF